MAKPVWTNDQIINQLDSGYHWSGSNLTYGFPTSASWFPYAEKNGFSALNGAQQSTATLVIKMWDDLIAPDFSLASTGSSANIKYSNTTTNIGYAQAYFPGTWASAGSVWFNSSYGSNSGTNNLVTPVVGDWGFVSYIHETGHALGLDHPGTYNGGSPTYANNALYAQDTQMYTVMSYFTANNTGADWYASNGRWYYPQTPMMHDILAIQAVYGAETTTRTGNTTYGFNATADVWVYNFSQNRHPVVCIYDAGGTDTLDLSGWSYSSVINLAPGSFSNADMMTYNISIAYGAWIENGIGGGGNDILTGNDLGNQLSGLAGNDTFNGGAGNDLLDGGTGTDSASFSGLFANYQIIWDAGTSSYVLTDLRTGSPDGQDRVTGVENFSFIDRTVAAADLIGAPPPPTGGPINGTAGNDVLNGTELADQIFGLAGNDSLFGFGGADLLDGGSGNDQMRGGSGDDTYVVGSTSDVVVEIAGEGRDLVQTTANLTLAANVEDLAYLGTGSFSGTGNSLGNVMTGGGGNDGLNGGSGTDTLFGLAGANSLSGGNDNDILVGGAGKDLAERRQRRGRVSFPQRRRHRTRHECRCHFGLLEEPRRQDRPCRDRRQGRYR